MNIDLKTVIHEMVDKIEDEAILVKVYTFVFEWLEGGAE